MKKIIAFALLAALCLLCGCSLSKDRSDTQAPAVGDPTQSQPAPSETNAPDWELSIDVDDKIEETEAVTRPDEGKETEPGETQATKPQESTPTESSPAESQPRPTEPEETKPQETKPGNGGIVLPFIPG